MFRLTTLAVLALLWPVSAPAQPAGPDLPKAPVPYAALQPKPAPRSAARPAATALPRSVATARESGPPSLTPAEAEAFVDGVVASAMGRDHIAGVTVAVVQNGQVLVRKGYGFASLSPRRPVDPDRSLFRIGSVSTTFTWIAVMKEVEAGRMRLDRPVNLYLPERIQVRDQGYQAPVTLADLMGHSAGFEDRALGHLFERDIRRVRPLTDYLRQERPRRVHAPGALASYSNYGAALAGGAVSYVSGKTFERQLEDGVLAPAGLRHTTFREVHAPRQGLPTPIHQAWVADAVDGYRWTDAGFQLRPYELIGQIAPAASASSTAADMARYMLLILNGGVIDGVQIYGPATARAFRTPLGPARRGVNGWAHGFAVYDLPGGRKGYGHAGATLSFTANMVTVPSLNLGIFVAGNTDTSGHLTRRLPEQLVRRFYGLPPAFPRPGSPELAANPSPFEGYYVSTRRAYSGIEGFVALLRSGARVSVTPQGLLLVETAEASRTWTPDGPLSEGVFAAADGEERLAFTMQHGHAVAFSPGTATAVFERAAMWRRPATMAILAMLTAACALATLAGVFNRRRRETRENQIQGRAGLIQNIQAGLWLLAMGLFALWAARSGDVAQVMFRWPGTLLVTASACALVAAVLTVTTVAAMPAVWRGGRRVDSWSALRKLGFTTTVLIYAAFSAILAAWGALSPWSG